MTKLIHVKGKLLLGGAWLLAPFFSLACECAGPPTFCESLDGPWSDPDVVVLGVKLDEVYYGMHVKVVSVFKGDAVAEDTIMVWGDNGGLCRWYVSMWNNGDTVLWAFHNTDFMGNIIPAGFPDDLEQPGDYHISACGIFWLPYANGVVTGAVQPGVSSMSITDVQGLVTGCVSTGIQEGERSDPLIVRYDDGGPWLSLATTQQAQLIITDALGRSFLQRGWNGAPLQLNSVPSGAYLVQVRTEERRWVRKVVVP